MVHATKDFPPITALPMLAYAIDGALDAAKDQLENMQEAKSKPHIFDDQLVNQIIKSYNKQNESIADEKALCIHWKKTGLSGQQKKTIDELFLPIRLSLNDGLATMHYGGFLRCKLKNNKTSYV